MLDPTEVASIDGYEVPQRLRAAIRTQQIADVFPFGTCLSPTMDLDHTERYVPLDYGGPPGQTRLGNLGPMARPSHRAVTHGGWAKHQPEPGYFVHRSPNGYVYLVTNQGTLALGRTNFSAPSGRPPSRGLRRSPPKRALAWSGDQVLGNSPCPGACSLPPATQSAAASAP